MQQVIHKISLLCHCLLLPETMHRLCIVHLILNLTITWWLLILSCNGRLILGVYSAYLFLRKLSMTVEIISLSISGCFFMMLSFDYLLMIFNFFSLFYFLLYLAICLFSSLPDLLILNCLFLSLCDLLSPLPITLIWLKLFHSQPHNVFHLVNYFLEYILIILFCVYLIKSTLLTDMFTSL